MPTPFDSKRFIQMTPEEFDAKVEAGDFVFTPSTDPTPESIEDTKQRFAPFLQTTFKRWYSSDPAKHTQETTPLLQDPRMEDYELRKQDIDPTKFGEYTINPEMASIDLEHIDPSKIKIIDPVAEGFATAGTTTRAEVFTHIMNTYGATHHLPGIEMWQYILEEKYNSAPPLPATAGAAAGLLKAKYESLKDGKWYYFPGSLVRHSDGYWDVPVACWSASTWDRSANWLSNAWRADGRVVLLEH